jgi:signal transduction histidine kinase/CheY-like chemotaxis protein
MSLNNEIKVLLLEDDQSDARLIRAYLQSRAQRQEMTPSYIVQNVSTSSDAALCLQDEQFDIILCDLRLPDSSGLETFNRIFTVAAEIPIIILSGYADERIALEAVQRGAQDYIHKNDLSPTLLARSIQYAIERYRLWNDLQDKTEKLAASEAQRRSIIAKNPDGIVILNKKGILRFINPAAEKILGKSKLELMGHPLAEIPLDSHANNEIFIERKNGTLAIIEFHLVETEWEGEAVFQASLRDITEHHRIREEISKQAAELRNQNIALDAFAGTTAHQIQGLLAQMVGYASFLQMHFMDGRSEEEVTAVQRIVQSGHKMNNVIGELLLLASIRDEAVQLHKLDMQRIINEAKKRLRYEIADRQPQLTQPDSWPVAFGHSSWVEEVWVNYINNAIKYGGDPLKIELGAVETENGMVEFWVQDNGRGISSENQKQLFKPHTRVYDRKVKGEGLGLSIVRQIVEKCGGKVGVESEVNGGSRFWFTLPKQID